MDDPYGNTLLYSLIPLAFYIWYLFLTAVETAIVSLADARLKKLGDSGYKAAKRLLRFTEKPSQLVASFKLLRMLTLLLLSAVVFYLCMPFIIRLSNRFTGGMFVLVLCIISFFLVFLLAFVLTLSAEGAKKIGSLKDESIAFRSSFVISVFLTLMTPISFLTSAFSKRVMRAMGSEDDPDSEDITEEEIRMMVDVGQEIGAIEQSEKDMINNIFEFNDTTVGEIMTHRTSIVGIRMGTPISQALPLIIEEGYSRIPVYKEAIDNIVGVLYVKDLLPLIGNGSIDKPAEDFMRPVFFVPETNRCRELFAQLKERKMSMAVVVDEYGGTSGIVTMEDLLESIVGNIQDEYDEEEEEIHAVSAGIFHIDGGADTETVSDHLNIVIPENDDYDTLGGFIIDLIGRIPEENEQIEVVFENVKFTVLKVEDRRIVKIQAEVLPSEE